jgi:hypothetical protein
MISATVRLRLKPCVTGRAKGAVERATGLRGNAQRAAIILGDEHRFDGVAVADVKQELARAVIGELDRRVGGGATAAAALTNFSRNSLAMSVIAESHAHAGTLMDPAQHLAGAEGLLALLREPGVRPSASKSSRLTVIGYCIG